MGIILARPRGHRATGIGLLVAIIGSFLFLTASPASAHHPVLVSADSTCGVSGLQVDFVSQTWAFSPQQLGGLHGNLDVEVDLNDGAGFRDLLDPVLQGSITDDESVIAAGNGQYVDPTRTFAGTFVAPAGTASVVLRITAVGPWGNGNGGGETATETVQLPAAGACSAPSASSTYQCVAGAGIATIDVANPTFDTVAFDVTLTGPGGVVGTQSFPAVDSATGAQQAVFADLANGAYTASVAAAGQPVAIGGSGDGAALTCDAAVGDRSFQDRNQNGLQDAGEPDQPVSSITLSNGTVDSDGDGSYLFEGLDPDQDYTVTFADVAGLIRTTRDAGDDSADSDTDATGVAPVDDLTPGETDLTVDAGYVLAPPPPVCASGDVVWANHIDLSSTSGGPGLPAVDVRLRTGLVPTYQLPITLPPEFGGPTVITSIEAVSWDGYWGRPSTPTQPVETWRVVFTNGGVPVGASGFTGDIADGVYSAGFSGLLDVGTGLVLPAGADGIILEHSSVSLSVSTAESVVPVAVCISSSPVPGSIGDRVWFDDNGDGVQDAGEAGINGVTVRLLDGTGVEIATDITAGDGLYLFENLPPGNYTVVVGDSTLPAGNLVQTFDLDGVLDHSSQEALAADEHTRVHDFGYQPLGAIGDRVWNDVDGDGVQDGGELGLNGVTVRLLDGNGVEIAAAVTSGDGDYLFSDLPAGTYTVVVDDSTLPADFVQTFDADGLGTPHRSTHVLGAAETNLDQDFGYLRPPASLGDTVWHDLDADGIQDGNEPGIPGVTVTLFVDGGAAIDSTTTGAAGDYQFTGLDPDLDYVVQFELLGGAFTTVNAGPDDAIDSDADPDTGRSHVVALDPGENDPTIDAGVVSLTPDVDIEKATNGSDADVPTGPIVPVGSTVSWTYVISNTGEYDLTNVIVTDNQGVVPVRLDITDVGGDDILSIGESWTYIAAGTAVQGQYANLGAVTGDPVVDGQPATDPFGEPFDPVTDDDPSHYLGFVPGEASIDIEKHTNGFDADSADPSVNPIPEVPEGGSVTWTYLVTNTSDELWLSNIVVTDDILGQICVINGPLAPFGTAECETDGLATAGSYENLGSVTGTPVDAQGNRAKNPDGTDIPEPTDNDPSHYIGLEGASLGDIVWFDANADGFQDGGEPGEPDVEVVLWIVDTDGLPDVEVASTTTDANGLYRFDDLDPTVEYIVQFLAGPLTEADASDDDFDSDADPITGFSHVIDLEPGEHDPTIDAGLLPGSIGDRVWLDLDGDGIQDDDEIGVEGVTVNLTDADCNVIATTTTDASGNYLFDNLPAGDYRIQVIAPDGTVLSPQDEGDDDAADSDVDDEGKTDIVDLDRGETDLTVDAGLIPLGSIGDFVFLDFDGDGLAPDDATPVAGVTVNLLDSDENQIGTTVTDGAGLYLFDGLPAGSYIVEFVEPEHFLLTLQREGDDRERDSDADPITGRTEIVELGIDEHRRDIDAGIYGENRAGNFAWFDANSNGLQDNGEAGIAGVVLELVMSGPNGVLDRSTQEPRIFAMGEVFADDGTRTLIADASTTVPRPAGPVGSSGADDDVVVATRTTDANGFYDFGSLQVGNYLICARLDSLPEGFILTTQNVRSNRADHIDNDVDPETGCTYPLHFQTGNGDLTIDLGVTRAAQVEQQNTTPLAFTGASSLQLALIALLMVGGGTLLLVVARRRDQISA